MAWELGYVPTQNPDGRYWRVIMTRPRKPTTLAEFESVVDATYFARYFVSKGWICKVTPTTGRPFS
jgi:hypothetical protein